MKNTNLESFAQNAKKLLETQIESRIAQIESGEITISVMDNINAVNKLMSRIKEIGRKSVIEEVAYTWFNRICAIRYMDARGYNSTLIVSPLPGMILPEILSDALSGIFDDDVVSAAQQERIRGILNGSIASDNKQRDIYRILLVSSCNALHKTLPVLFEEIKDYTDLLLPEDLLSSESIIAKTVEAMTEEDCQSVEIIGWLYQYYISEKKNQVMKKKKNRGADEIPAATQLFTPDWIVHYLVENSIGRLWMQNHPSSTLKNNMSYFIDPQIEDQSYIEINSPEEFRICDPCCGSGHMLTYSFDILMLIYEECGYTNSDSVALILKNNIYGIEIDSRAGQLAYFALMMKAREKDRRLFHRESLVSPNICVLSNYSFSQEELNQASSFFKNEHSCLKGLLKQFENSDILGSIITPCINNIAALKADIKEPNLGLFDSELLTKLKNVLNQAEYLTCKYNIVITNPPYIAPSTCNSIMANYAISNYPNSKADLGTMFIERNFKLAVPKGLIAMITLHSWMFLKFENLRSSILSNTTITSMAHVEASGFDSISGEVVQTTAFILLNKSISMPGYYYQLGAGKNEKEKSNILLNSIRNKDENFFVVSPDRFYKIPNKRIGYWVSDTVIECFENPLLNEFALPKQGLATGDNDRFLRLWHEVSLENVKFPKESFIVNYPSKLKWFPCNKGGTFRKWYGNNNYLVNWEDNGYEMVNAKGSVIRNSQFYFREGITWSSIANALSMRYCPAGYIFETKGSMCFPVNINIKYLQGLLNSKVASVFLSVFSRTLDFHEGPMGLIPVIVKNELAVVDLVEDCIDLARQDWDAYENSWDFKRDPLIEISSELYDATSIDAEMTDYYGSTVPVSSPIELCYLLFKGRCNHNFETLKDNEQELNHIMIANYGLGDELSANCEDSDISIHCVFDTSNDIPDTYKENKYILLREEVIKNFISYAVGCIFGRYSLVHPGLAFAGGEWNIYKYEGGLMPDSDNVVPVMTDTWFDNDIENQFINFVVKIFGKDSLNDNLKFIEKVLGKSLRKYFSKDFYKDHLKKYQKRPIYWMFSSPKGYFKALVYMHRYNENTANIVLSQLRDLRAKIRAQLDAARKDGNTKLENDYMVMDKDLDEYENEILYPLAVEHVTFDLDNGVKVNYQKLGKALVPIK